MRLQDIKQAVELVSGLKLSSRSRETEYVCARLVYYEIAKKYTFMSLKDIGGQVGRDHATVLYALYNTSQSLNKKEAYGTILRKSLIQLGVVSEEPVDSDRLMEENRELRKLLSRDDDFISKIRHLNDEQYELFKERADVMLRFVQKTATNENVKF